MKKILSILVIITILENLAIGANSAIQVVTYQLSAINDISVSDANVPALNVNSATNGVPDPVTSSGLTYSVTTNAANGTEKKKITAALTNAMPSASNVLNLTLANPNIGSSTSLGKKALSTAALDMVNEIDTPGSESGVSQVHEYAPTSAAYTHDAITNTITLTITNQ
jgi:hypothetical protein